MIPPPPASSEPSPQRRPRKGRRLGGPRVVAVAFAISALAHLGFLVLYPILMERIAPGTAVPAPPGPVAEPQGIEVVRVAEAPEERPVEEPEEPEEPEPAPREPAPDAAGAEEPAEEAAEIRSAAERLRVPGEGDARIWRPVDPDLTELTDEQWARIRLELRLEEMSDSMRAVAEAARRATDWTYTDDEGNRWGVSPGRLHLGKVSIPLPFGFSAPPSARDAAAAWRWDDVERGAQTSIVRDTWKERIEAIRERRDAERADSTGTRP